jgi:HlyD family secretion protein
MQKGTRNSAFCILHFAFHRGYVMKKLLIGVAVLALLGAGVYGVFLRGEATETTTEAPPSTPVTAEETLVAEAKVVPAQYAALSLPIGGVIAEVLVQEGDQVQSGQALLRLDRAGIMAEVARAEAQLAQAQATYDNLVAGATPEEIAAADAQLRVAQAQLRQTEGSVTNADRAAATAQLQQAQAHLAELRAGPKPLDLRSAEVQLEQAQTNLAAQRDQLSAAKTEAQLQMQQLVNDLTEAQAAYATAKRNWEYAQETGKDPNAVLDPNTGKKTRMKLDDKQKQHYYDAYVQAEAAMHRAEVAVTQAQVAYDAARAAEVSGIQAAEQQVVSAQTDLDRLRAGADADELAAARAQMASSQASIDKLDGAQRGGALEGAQASVDQAKADLDRLRTGATKSDLAVAAAEVQSAGAGLKLAQVALSEAELRAPFAGVIAALEPKIGEYVAPGTPIIHLADLSAWRIETTDLTELNVVSVEAGSPAQMTFDAIPDLKLLGKVGRVRALGENKQGDITYVVTIDPDRYDGRLRWNMTASVTIVP